MIKGLARERISTLLFYGTVLLLAYLLYLLFRPFLTALAWAAILAAFFFPAYRRLSLRWGASWAAAASTAAVAILIVGPHGGDHAVGSGGDWHRLHRLVGSGGEFDGCTLGRTCRQFGGRLGSLADIITQARQH